MQDNDLPQIGTPMQTDETRVEVIQADRQVWAKLYIAQLTKQHDGYLSWMKACTAPILLGSEDAAPEMQIIARHRDAFAAPPAVEREEIPPYMHPIEECSAQETGDQVWLWHRLWKAGPLPGYFDVETQWWRIGEIGSDNWYGVGIFPSHCAYVAPFKRIPEFIRSKEWWIARIDAEPDGFIAAGAPAPTLHPSDREAIAIVVDPAAWDQRARHHAKGAACASENEAQVWYQRAVEVVAESLRIADAILALSGPLAPEGGSDEPERMVSEDLAARLDPAPDMQPIGRPKLWQRRSGRPSTEKGETK